MLSATEFMTTTTTLYVVLCIEAVVYLGIGVYEFFDDFLRPAKPWTFVNNRPNHWLQMQDKVGHKMHAALCMLLGFIALNGVIEGQVSRFEIELIFISFALLTGVIWGILPPGRLGLITVLSKPEVWLQIAMYATSAALVRPWILVLCAVLNAWGVLVYFKHHRPSMQPFTFATLRAHAAEVESPEMLARLDKVGGEDEPQAAAER
ncbi:MAG: hypothetical protein AAF513_11535 [Pseudomonadota bacterium]